MKGRFLNAEIIEEFGKHLVLEEKSEHTIEKYMRDVRAFWSFAGNGEITKETAIAYKNHLLKTDYAVRSINSMLASINSLFVWLEWFGCRVKALKTQKQIFCPEEKELTKAEYLRLVNTAKQNGNERLNLILQTICSTGHCLLQGQNPRGVSGQTAAKKAAPLLREAGYRFWLYLYHPHRQADQSNEHLAGDEIALCAGQCRSS